jgi:pyrroloquinoline quinone biosynthesis protein D
MTMALAPAPRYAFSALHRLQWEESQQKHVILYPEGMVELNGPAAEILKLCDGTRDLDGIVEELEQKFETTGIRDDVAGLLEAALNNGWIRAVS